uniref:Uncharacterized protein n=1 Tax=Arundo donax TaxID=35708 RepID=A0A0A9A9D4_ARUDO
MLLNLLFGSTHSANSFIMIHVFILTIISS